MAAYLVHYVARDLKRDYEGFDATLDRMGATQLTEELWTIESELGTQELTKILFSDRPPSDRFLLMKLPYEVSWSAANLIADPRETFAEISRRQKAVMVFSSGQAPRRLPASSSA